MSFVVDASVALAWVFEDEVSDSTEALLDQIGEPGASAPSLWPLEVLNALTVAERRKRIGADDRVRLAALLRDLPIELDADAAMKSWTSTLELAARTRITIYDAAYLELAQRVTLPPATLDRELRRAAEACSVAVLSSD